MNMEFFVPWLWSFYTKYGLNIDFVTYNSCVQAVNKYIKGLDIAVQSSKSLKHKKIPDNNLQSTERKKKSYGILVKNKTKVRD